MRPQLPLSAHRASSPPGKPLIYGAIQKFEGQVSVFNYRGGPNYRDLFPQPPPPGEVPSCAEGGVLGVLPGVIGCMQATEAIKVTRRPPPALYPPLSPPPLPPSGSHHTTVSRLLWCAVSVPGRARKVRRHPLGASLDL